MTDLYAAVNDRRVVAAVIRFPWAGAWSAELELDQAGAAVSGAVTITLGSLTLQGTVDDEHSEAFAEGRRLVVIGGANGWSTELPPKGYHNDGGVKASEVLQHAAAAAGETLSLEAALTSGRVGVGFVRERGPASAVIAAAPPAAVWWVDAAGVTQIATARPSAELDAKADLELLDFDRRLQVATLAGDPSAVGIGTVLRYPERLEAPFVVRELVLRLDEDGLRIEAHAIGEEVGGRILGPFVRLARSVRDERLPGLYRYRVVAMADERAKLQAVSKGRWPDILPASLASGIAGGWASLAGGAIVDVAFEDEDRTRPVILGYTPKGQAGHVPTEAHVNASSLVELGADSASVKLAGGAAAVARVNDIVGYLLFDSMAFTLYFSPSLTTPYAPVFANPNPGTPPSTPGSTGGTPITIGAGSSRVKSG